MYYEKSIGRYRNHTGKDCVVLGIFNMIKKLHSCDDVY